MSLRAKERHCRAVIDTILPPSVRSVVARARHVPQPDVETQRGFAARLRMAAAAEAPIDAVARCLCGRPIVNDEVYGWLHLAAAEQPTRDNVEAALPVAVGPHVTMAARLQQAGRLSVRLEENVSVRRWQHGMASQPWRMVEEVVVSPAGVDRVWAQGWLQVFQGFAVGGSSQVRFLLRRNNSGLHADAARGRRRYAGAALQGSWGCVLTVSAEDGRYAAPGWCFRPGDEQAVAVRGSMPRGLRGLWGLRMAGWW